MKCPHCGFVTFDHLQSCPRCKQSFALVRPLTQQGRGESPHVLRDEPGLRGRLRDRLRSARLDRRKQNQNPLASGSDPDAPEWYRPGLDSDEGPAEQDDGGTTRWGETGKEVESVDPADPSSKEDSQTGAGTEDAFAGDDAASESDSSANATSELPFGADQPGFTDWRVELRERLKKIRARRESEQEEAAASEVIDSEVPTLDEIDLAVGEADDTQELELPPQLEQTLDQPGDVEGIEDDSLTAVGGDTGDDNVIELAEVLGGAELTAEEAIHVEDADEPAGLAEEAREVMEETVDRAPGDHPADESLDIDPAGETAAELPDGLIAEDATSDEESEIEATGAAGKAATGWDRGVIADLQASSTEAVDVDLGEDAQMDGDIVDPPTAGPDEAPQEEIAGVVTPVEQAEDVLLEAGDEDLSADNEDFTLEEEGVTVADEELVFEEIELLADDGEIAVGGAEVASTGAIEANAVLEPADIGLEELVGDHQALAETTTDEEHDDSDPLMPATAEHAGESLGVESSERHAAELEFDEADDVEVEPAPDIELDIDDMPAETDAGLEWDTPGSPGLMRPATSGLDQSAAPLGQRLIAGIADTLVLVIIAGVLVTAASSASGAAYDVLLADALLPLAVTWSIFAFGYLVFFTGTCGQTIGKMIMRLRVISTDQLSVGFGRAAKRLIVSVPSILALGIGFFLAARDPKRRTVYDRVAQTRVIRA